MVKNSTKKVINFLGSFLKNQGLNVSKIILFGSHTHGKIHDDSDIDIVIVSKDFKGKDIFERAKLTKEAEIVTIRKFMAPLDIITLTPEEFEDKTSLISSYAKNGKTIYAA